MRGNETDSGESVLLLDSDISELERLGKFLDSFCESTGMPDEICYQLQVALEELVINAIKHGGCKPKQGAIRLAIKRVGDEVIAVLSDNGIVFNPLETPAPDLTKSLQERPVGGLGIHLVRNLIPSLRYERRGDRNYLHLTKRVKPDSGTVSPEEESYANGDGNHQS